MADGERYDGRLAKRYQVKDGLIALDSVSGDLIDISFGGLAFRYASSETGPRKAVEFGIILGGEALYFDQVPLLNVADLALDEKDGKSGGAVRRRGMRFGRLSCDDLARLARFIRKHALAGKEKR